MKTNLISGATLFLSIQLGAALHYPQYLQGFHKDICEGTFTLFLGTNTNITETFLGIHHKSILLQGLWRYEQFNEDFNQTITTTSRSAECDPGVIGGDLFDLTSVIKLAAGDLDDSVLTLFPSAMFYGEPVVVDEHGASKIEIYNFEVNSYVFTGPQSFSVFDGENFTGNATCLEVSGASRDDGYGTSLRPDLSSTPLLVKSAKVGCTGKEGRTISGNLEKSRISWNSNGVKF